MMSDSWICIRFMLSVQVFVGSTRVSMAKESQAGLMLSHLRLHCLCSEGHNVDTIEILWPRDVTFKWPSPHAGKWRPEWSAGFSMYKLITQPDTSAARRLQVAGSYNIDFYQNLRSHPRRQCPSVQSGSQDMPQHSWQYYWNIDMQH
jgi:hypothetical protein